jgi:hypothetical protein
MRRTLAVFLCLFIAYAILASSVRLPSLLSLMCKHDVTMGTIVSVTPEDHDTYHYSFRVLGLDYDGAGFIDKRDIRTGQQIKIKYCPGNPKWSAPDDLDLESAFRWEIAFVVLSATILPAIGTLILALRLQLKPRTMSDTRRGGKP